MGVSPTLVIPAQAGIQKICESLDSGFRRNDGPEVFSDSLLDQHLNQYPNQSLDQHRDQ
jgi:hypothetical protein